jgi:proline iminopeptidase
MKKALLISGVVTLVAYVAGQLMQLKHSSLTDFTQTLTVLALLVFLSLLFIIRPSAISVLATRRKVFQYFRVAVLLCLGLVVWMVFVPRHYGSPAPSPRESTRYWTLASGSRIAYTLIPGKGVRKPYPIIYLQGGPGCPIGDENIRDLSPFAEEGYAIYLYDPIGCGFSGRLKNIREYTAERQRRDLEGIVAAIGAPKVILIGQSWGAILAVLYAADNPRNIEKIVVTGPGPIMPIRPELGNLKAPDSLHLREPYYSNAQGNRAANNVRTRFMSFCALQWGIKLASDAESDDFGSYLNGLLNRSTVCDTGRLRETKPLAAGVGFYAQLMTAASFPRLQDPRPKLKNTRIPILVMKGQCDNQRWGFTHEYLELFPNHRLVVIPDAGHAISQEKPVIYLNTIRSFLDDEDRPAPISKKDPALAYPANAHR